MSRHSISKSLIYRALFVLIAIMALSSGEPLSAKKKPKDKGKSSQSVPGLPSPMPIQSMVDERGPKIDQPSINMIRSRSTDSNGKTGIDVSHYQHSINWSEVSKDTKVTFAIIKATEASDFVDNRYHYNIREARRNGIPVGSYHFYRANVDPELQFRNMMRNIDPTQQDILPVIDVEQTNGVSYDLFLSRLERLCEMVYHEYGERPIIYTGKNFFSKYFNSTRWRHYKFWIAAYTPIQPELAGERDYIMWQYTDNSRIKGISGAVDRSCFVYGHTIEDIRYHGKRR